VLLYAAARLSNDTRHYMQVDRVAQCGTAQQPYPHNAAGTWVLLYAAACLSNDSRPYMHFDSAAHISTAALPAQCCWHPCAAVCCCSLPELLQALLQLLPAGHGKSNTAAINLAITSCM
jgi:hypothetical protein